MTQNSSSTIEKDLAEAISSVSKLRRDDYPPGWKIVQLGEIIDIQGGSQPPKDQFIYEPREGFIRLLQIRDFGDKPVPTYVPKDKVTKFCNKEDIFIARYGASLGRIVTNMEGAYNVALAKVIFDCAVVFPKYMFYLLQTPYFQTPIHMISRSAQNGFNKGEIFPIELPLAPLQSQKRIVAEIEKQFSRLDEAVATLKRVKANLKRYKASVLKAAVEGNLTEDWRKQHPYVEPASKLLERILAERRAKQIGKERTKVPATIDTSNLSVLPNGWMWCITDALFSYVTSGSRGWAQHYSSKGPLFLRIGNLDHDSIRLDLKDIQRVKPPKGVEGTRTKVEEGDVLVSITADVGMIAVAPLGLGEAYINQHVALARPVLGICREYLAWYLASRDGGQKEFRRLQRGATKAGLGLDDIRAVPVPLPPLAEQEQIIAEVERRLSLIDELEDTVEANLTRADRLRHAVLRNAFCGVLPLSEEHAGI